MDILGNTIIKLTPNTGSVQVDLTQYPKGIYILKIMDEKGKMGMKKIATQ